MFGIREKTAASHIHSCAYCSWSLLGSLCPFSEAQPVWFWKPWWFDKTSPTGMGRNAHVSFQTWTKVEAVIAFGGAKADMRLSLPAFVTRSSSPACGLCEMLSTKGSRSPGEVRPGPLPVPELDPLLACVPPP